MNGPRSCASLPQRGSASGPTSKGGGKVGPGQPAAMLAADEGRPLVHRAEHEGRSVLVLMGVVAAQREGRSASLGFQRTASWPVACPRRRDRRRRRCASRSRRVADSRRGARTIVRRAGCRRRRTLRKRLSSPSRRERCCRHRFPVHCWSAAPHRRSCCVRTACPAGRAGSARWRCREIPSLPPTERPM